LTLDEETLLWEALHALPGFVRSRWTSLAIDR